MKDNTINRLREFEIPLMNHTRYLGVYVAAHSIPDAVIVLHMGTGCKMKGGMHHFDLLRESFSQVCWTEVSGVDIIADSHAMIEDTVLTSYERRRPGCIAVATSSVIEMTGFDMREAVASIQQKVSCPLIYIPTSGFEGDVFDGHAEFTRELMTHVDWQRPADANVVNIVGHFMERYEFDQMANINEVKRMLAGIGLRTGAFFYSGQPAAQLFDAWRGGLNVVMPYYGDHVHTLEMETGRPSLMTDMPIGVTGSVRWLESVSAAAGIPRAVSSRFIETEIVKITRLIDIARPMVRGIRVIIIQTAPMAAACAAHAVDLGMTVTDVALLGTSHGCKSEFAAAWERYTGGKLPEDIRVFDNSTASDLWQIYDGKDKKQPVLIAPSIDMPQEWIGNIHHLEIGFPSNAKRNIYALPYMGFNGAVMLTQRLMDAVAHKF